MSEGFELFRNYFHILQRYIVVVYVAILPKVTYLALKITTIEHLKFAMYPFTQLEITGNLNFFSPVSILSEYPI